LASAKKGVNERAFVISSAGVDDHARRLVDGDYVIVFVDDLERDGFGFGTDGRARLGCDGDAFSATKTVRRFRRFPIEQDVCRVDELLYAGAGEVGAVRGDNAIQALISVFGRGYEVVRH
jgi:hypothetical protein